MGDLSIRSSLAIALLSVCLTVPLDARADLAPGLYTGMSLSHAGQLRSYDVLVPASYTGASSVPLVVDLHGFSRSPLYQRTNSGFATLAESQGFIVAWPAGLGAGAASTGWSAGVPCFSVATGDVGFIRAMVGVIRNQVNVNAKRIYVTGHSCGGAMTHRLACEASDLFAAAATFAWPVPMVPCSPARPIPVWMTASRQDLRLPYLGGYIDGNPANPIVPSAADALIAWRTRDGCSGSTPDVTETPGATSVCERYTNCLAGTQVGLCSVDCFFPPNNHLPSYPNVGDGFDTQARAWQFMSGFTLPVSTPVFPFLRE